jgi:hypothetical protein
MTPKTADKMAKAMRLALDPAATDGEKLAAITAVSAMALAAGVDWDQVLANGKGGPALTEDQLNRVYTEGFNRGLAEGQQQAMPAADSKKAATTLGSDAQRLAKILDAAAKSRDAGLLSAWEVQFSDDMRDRFESWGSRMYVYPKQLAALQRLEVKLTRQDFL